MSARHAVFRAGLLGCLFLGEASSACADGGWGFLRLWAGHGPGAKLGSDGRSLFAQPRVDAALRRLLSPEDLALVREQYSLWDQFSVVGHYLVGDACKPHDCGALNATVVFDLDGSGVWVMLFAHGPSVVSSRWFGTGDYLDLPADVRSAVAAVHRPSP